MPNVDLILMEEDQLKGKYGEWHKRLFAAGFENVWRARDSFDPGNRIMDRLFHTAWFRRNGSSRPGRQFVRCDEYAATMRFDPGMLRCMPLLSPADVL